MNLVDVVVSGTEHAYQVSLIGTRPLPRAMRLIIGHLNLGHGLYRRSSWISAVEALDRYLLHQQGRSSGENALQGDEDGTWGSLSWVKIYTWHAPVTTSKLYGIFKD